MNDSTGKLVVKPYHPPRERQRILLILGFVIISFFLGLITGGKWFEVEMVEKRELKRNVTEMHAAMRLRQHQLSAAQLAAEVDEAALEVVRLDLSDMQKKLADNTNELTLYRNLLQKEGSSQSLLISDFSLAENDQGGFAYRLIVQQRAGKLKTIKVTAAVAVHGEQGGKSVVLSLAELDPEQKKPVLGLEFRYFYVHDGVMQLPAEFTPSSVKVKIWPTGKKSRVIQRDFSWAPDAG